METKKIGHLLVCVCDIGLKLLCRKLGSLAPPSLLGGRVNNELVVADVSDVPTFSGSLIARISYFRLWHTASENSSLRKMLVPLKFLALSRTAIFEP